MITGDALLRTTGRSVRSAPRDARFPRAEAGVCARAAGARAGRPRRACQCHCAGCLLPGRSRRQQPARVVREGIRVESLSMYTLRRRREAWCSATGGCTRARSSWRSPRSPRSSGNERADAPRYGSSAPARRSRCPTPGFDERERPTAPGMEVIQPGDVLAGQGTQHQPGRASCGSCDGTDCNRSGDQRARIICRRVGPGMRPT